MAVLTVGIAVLPVTVACTTDENGDVVPLPSASLDLPSGVPTAFPTEIGDTDDSIQVGETVELTGTVVEDGAFILELEVEGQPEPVPVLTLESLTVNTGDQVTVKGRWVTFDAATLEDEVGVDLDDDLVARYSGQKGILATSLDK